MDEIYQTYHDHWYLSVHNSKTTRRRTKHQGAHSGKKRKKEKKKKNKSNYSQSDNSHFQAQNQTKKSVNYLS